MRRTIRCALMGCVLASLGFTRLASATSATVPISYMLEDMTNFSSCDYPCSLNSSLSYSEAQIALTYGKLNEVTGNSEIQWWDNEAWSSDLGEDRDFNGEDYLWGDAPSSSPVLYTYSGHGGNPVDSGGREHFTIPMCTSASGFTGGWGDPGSECELDVTRATRLGDDTRGGYYNYPHPGSTRWAVLMTCYSVDTVPCDQWCDAFQGAFQYVCGYRGESHDAESTDDTGANFVNDAFVYHNYEFKATWFAAAGSFWYDDMAEVFTRGTSSDNANYRRDHYRASDVDDGSQLGGYWAAAWHNACFYC